MMHTEVSKIRRIVVQSLAFASSLRLTESYDFPKVFSLFFILQIDDSGLGRAATGSRMVAERGNKKRRHRKALWYGCVRRNEETSCEES